MDAEEPVNKRRRKASEGPAAGQKLREENISKGEKKRDARTV